MWCTANESENDFGTDQPRLGLSSNYARINGKLGERLDWDWDHVGSDAPRRLFSKTNSAWTNRKLPDHVREIWNAWVAALYFRPVAHPIPARCPSWQLPDPSCQLPAARVGMSSRPSTLAFKWKAICLLLANNSVSGLSPSSVLRPTRSADQSIKQQMLHAAVPCKHWTDMSMLRYTQLQQTRYHIRIGHV